MPYRLTKIYTRSGDDGYTHLRDQRIAKDDLLVEAIGTIDELNSTIGVVLAQSIIHADIKNYLTQIQHELFDMGGELHLPQHQVITPGHVAKLEDYIDALNHALPPLTEFILPRGSMACTTCHVARAVCRRTERCLVKLHRQVPLTNIEMLRYINRLSDLLFVMARTLNKEDQQEELLWHNKS